MKRRFKGGTTARTTKGYLRIVAGPLRHKYVHRIIAAAMIGRELTKDEQVHHKDGSKLNVAPTNLFVLGEKDHGWVSSKQAWYMAHIKEPTDKADWDEFMASEDAKQVREIAACKAAGETYQIRDGELREKWEATR